MRLFNFYQFSPEELQRLCWLRAIEWLTWPGFLSQPLLPILYIFYPVYGVLALAFIADLLWLPFRHHLVSLQLATLGCFWVRLKWVTIPIGVIFLLHQRRYAAAFAALATPWFAGLPIPGKVGIVETKFWRMAVRSYSAELKAD
jgi:hypothetical protein